MVLVSAGAYFAAFWATFYGMGTGGELAPFLIGSAVGSAILLIGFHFLCAPLKAWQFWISLGVMAAAGLLFVVGGVFGGDEERFTFAFIGWQLAMMFLLAYFAPWNQIVEPENSVSGGV
jgi:hypothetical protein